MRSAHLMSASATPHQAIGWHSPMSSAKPPQSLLPPIARGAAMSFRPLHDRIVLRRTDSEEKSAGGIIIPDNAQEKPSEGVVEAVGPGARDDSGKIIKPDVKAGDRVLFGKWSGTEVKLDGNDLLIIKESDVMGVITA